MRNIKISPNEHYHVFNRGNAKQPIFLDEMDYVRFMFCILYFQSDVFFNNLGFYTSYFKRHKRFNVSSKIKNDVIKNKKIELINFCLMPNHFHLTILEKEEGGIASYTQRVLNAYTKYFNTKYKRSGHLFQGPYKAVHIENNRQLVHLSTYIHKNPKELSQWRSNEINYPWSSYQDYAIENRWELLLKPEIISEQFKNKEEYISFVKTSTAKETTVIN